MSIIEFLICAGTAVLVVLCFALLVFAVLGVGALVARGVCYLLDTAEWLFERQPKWFSIPIPTWVLCVILVGLCIAGCVLLFVTGCLIAHDFGWIADCPWCEVTP